MRPLVVLRPEPGATATCNTARAMGLHPIAIPLFTIEALPWKAPDGAGFDGLLLTSANAIRHGGVQLDKLRGLPVYAVGPATAEAARAHGFAIRAVGPGRVDDLLASIGQDLRLLHLCGEQRHQPAAPRQAIAHVPVYTAPALTAPDLSEIVGAVVAVHSPRAGARLAELTTSAGMDVSGTTIAAISREAGQAAGAGWQEVVAADEPSESALLALAARLCNSPGR